jgi:hypothetical protein
MAGTSGLPPLENTRETVPSITRTIIEDIILEKHSSKDIMIGGGVLLALTIIFFFIRNAFVNYLVSSLKRSPNNAGLAGWLLFGGLFFGSSIGCLALISNAFLTRLYIAPLAVLSLIFFILCIVVAAKK